MHRSVTHLTAPTSFRSPRIRHTIMRTLIALFGLLLLAFLLVADGSNRINRLSDRALDGIYPMMKGAQSLVVTFRLLADQLAAAASLSDKAQLDVTRQTASRFREQIDELRACSSSPEETAELDEIRILFDRYYEEGTQVAKAMIQGNDVEGAEGLPLGMRSFSEDTQLLKRKLALFLSKNERSFRDVFGDIDRNSHRILNIVGALAIVTVLFGVAMTYLASAAIIRPIEELSGALRGMAAGDLSRRVEVRRHDEVGILAESANRLAEELDSSMASLVAEKQHVEQQMTDLKRARERERELQGQLAIAERMESLGLLAGGVAHDLNNILGPIVGYPDLILAKLPLDSPVRKDLTQIRESAQRAAAVIQDLLALARRGQYRMEPLDVKAVIESFLASPNVRELQARHPGVTVEVHADPGPCTIVGSAPHLTRVIMNLMANAFEAMPQGGTLVLTTACERSRDEREGEPSGGVCEAVVIEVKDTGTGIPPEDVGRIFDPFFTTKKLGRSGTGLGLAIVHGVVKDLGGDVGLDSKVGEGTTFRVRFPYAGIAGGGPQEVTGDYRGEGRILIVDDVKEQRVLAQRILADLGYEVATVANGRAAVEHMREHPADLVVLDMIMEEGFDGLDTLRAILDLRPGQPCIIASGFSETDRAKEAASLGAGAFISKPYSRDEIGRVVRQELSRARALAAPSGPASSSTSTRGTE